MAESQGTSQSDTEPTPQESTRNPEIFDGMLLPTKPGGNVVSISTHIPRLRHMKLRDDDIFLCVYPKAGTNWCWEVLSMLRQGKADYEKRTKVQLMVEFVDIEQLEEQPSPRIFNTHLPFSMLPVQEMKAKRTKVVHVYRNIKDVIVSMYCFVTTGKFPVLGDLNFEEFTEKHLSGEVPYGGYFDYLKQVADFSKANPEVPLISVAYEDMKKNPVPTVRRLAEFLEVPVSDQLCQDIAQACSFQKMKDFEKEKANVNFGGDDIQAYTFHEPQEGVEEKTRAVFRQRPVIYRKGEVGDWKNYFTVALNEKVDAVIREKMAGLPFTFQYT